MLWNRLSVGWKPEPPTRFVVVSLPRSGTHMLGSLLNQHPEIWTETELFNEHSDYCQQWRGRSADWVLKQIAWRGRSGQICGFLAHLCFGQRWKLWECLTKLPDVRYICLQRDNLFEQFVSLEQAAIHKRWQVYRPEDRPALQSLRLEPEAVEAHFRFVQTHWDRFERSFAERPRHVVSYNDLCFQTELVSRQVQRFLGATVIDGLRPQTIKVGRPTHELVSNYQELCNFFRDSEYACHFDRQSGDQPRRAA